MYIPPGLSREQIVRYRKVAKDPRAFIRLLRIFHKDENRIVPFDLNAAQIDLLEVLLTSNRIIVLKARQMGMSTIIRAYIFWQMYVAEEPIRWGSVLHHEKSYKAFNQIDAAFIDNLPEKIKRKIKHAKESYVFEDTSAWHELFTAGSKTGTRAFSFGAGHLSEFAFYGAVNEGDLKGAGDPSVQREVLGNVSATVGRGQIIIESTPGAPGDHFYNLVVGAPANGWTLLTYWWWQHEPNQRPVPPGFERTAEEQGLERRYGTVLTDSQLQWRREEIASYDKAVFTRENPGCLEDAFAFPEAAWFKTDDLDAIEAVPWGDDPHNLQLEAYDPDDVYVMGSDVGGGVGKDYSTAWVISYKTRQPVFVYRSNTISPLQFGDKLVEIAVRWDSPFICLEGNNHGLVVFNRLMALDYNNVWTRDGKPWSSNVKTKTEMYSLLKSHTENGVIDRLDTATKLELARITLARHTAAPAAPGSMHDDLADALALGYIAHRDMPSSQRPKPKTPRHATVKPKQLRRRTVRSPLGRRT